MLKFGITLYCVSNLALSITYVKFDTQNNIDWKRLFLFNANNLSLAHEFDTSLKMLLEHKFYI